VFRASRALILHEPVQVHEPVQEIRIHLLRWRAASPELTAECRPARLEVRTLQWFNLASICRVTHSMATRLLLGRKRALSENSG
jgi:hypothetical protein